MFEGNPAPRTPAELETRLRALLDRAAGAAPLSIHIEDAQWIDRASRRLIDSLNAGRVLAGPPNPLG